MRVVVLAGGVGGAKLAHGLQQVLAPGDLTVIVNTGDDLVLHGLRVSPDLDTVMYTLASLDAPTGWGVRDESWNASDMLARYGAPTWFALGDRDLATHVFRTARLAAGSTLSAVTDTLRRALGVPSAILPMTDDDVRTEVCTDAGWLEFQDWFVGRRHADPVSEVRFRGIERARPAGETLAAISSAEVVAVAPSNPFVSVGTILALPGLLDALLASAAPVVAVSPIVAGAAIKGPADRMLESLGGEASAFGVARLYVERYPGLLDRFVLDVRDQDAEARIAALGVRTLTADTIMSDEAGRARVARAVLDAARPAP